MTGDYAHRADADHARKLARAAAMVAAWNREEQTDG